VKYDVTDHHVVAGTGQVAEVVAAIYAASPDPEGR
jgi:hypothetical protein